MQNKKRIQLNFTGASGTGKTTLLNAVKEKYPELEVGTEVVRNLIKTRDIKINEMGDEDGQKLIFNTYDEYLTSHVDKDYVSDRCIIDPAAYTLIHVANHQVPSEILDEQWKRIRERVLDGTLTTVFYFPIEFANVHDGVRSDNDDFRKETDAAIRGIINGVEMYHPGKLKVITVRGSVEGRMKIIDDYIQSLE